MFQQLLIGSAVICVTLLAQTLCIGGAIAGLRRMSGWLASSWSLFKFVTALTFVVLSVVIGVALCAWIWGMVFMHLNVVENFETAIYFSIVTFTTLGYGDIVLAEQWRLLSGLTATNGLIVFGLNTAFLVEVLSRLGRTQEPN